MKYITAIIKPFKFSELKDALATSGISGMTISEVSGFGRQRGQTEVYRGAEYTSSMLPKIKIEIAAPDELVDTVLDIIRATANNNEIGDGKIFVTRLADVVRIRTGERGEIAL
jgi:nitrogen regulatory protein P-II 2